VTPVFADTSALLALLNAQDVNYPAAERAFCSLRARRAGLITTSYVLVETYGLLGRRLGLEAVRAFREEFSPLIEVVWVDETLHQAGLDLVLSRRKRGLSLADAVSFVVMRQRNLEEAFAFDPDFQQEGFLAVT
jgi:predicted nucleic acid-binding protein